MMTSGSTTHCVEEMMTFYSFYTLHSGILQSYTLRLGNKGILQFYALH